MTGTIACESLSHILLPPVLARDATFLHCLGCVAVHLFMRLDVAGDTEQPAVVWVICKLLHFLLALSRLYRDDVVAVHAWCNVSLGLASFAQSVGSLPYDAFHVLPFLGVQQLLVSLVSAHSPTILLREVASPFVLRLVHQTVRNGWSSAGC